MQKQTCKTCNELSYKITIKYMNKFIVQYHNIIETITKSFIEKNIKQKKPKQKTNTDKNIKTLKYSLCNVYFMIYNCMNIKEEIFSLVLFGWKCFLQ